MKNAKWRQPRPAEAAASIDSVRAYCSRLGRVPLLTRESEVALARRIEEAETRIVQSLVESPIAIAELARVAAELRGGKLHPRELTRDPVDETDPEPQRRRLLGLLDVVGALQAPRRSGRSSTARRLARARSALESVRLARAVVA
ncbi:MAG TPA: sigma-70 factor domain-containing protein, partial [Polyangiaceae bacterium]|nr:sigma-70 factor domain-containing protein [Polyangiaceae bacterium]